MLQSDPTVYGYWLWFFLLLFVCRVLGQVVVVLFHPRWLPAMEQWYSGLLPYRYLLPVQLLMVLFMAWICFDFTHAHDHFTARSPGVGRAPLYFSYVYFGSMVLRYIVRMRRRPDQRWLGGAIPIIFHCVLAAYLFVLGRFYVS